MNISLPFLFATSLVIAPVGLVLLLAQLRWPNRATFAAGGIGGVAAWLLLQFILVTIDQEFMGWYKPAASAIAFFAGYAPAAVGAYALRFTLSRSGRAKQA